jgi:hypothetical protein
MQMMAVRRQMAPLQRGGWAYVQVPKALLGRVALCCSS